MKRSKKEVTPNWHPNFRVADSLPDIKPIRTGFLINVAAVSICLGLIYMFGQQEMTRLSLGGKLKELETVKQASGALNTANLAKSNEFINNAKKLQDLMSFYGGPVTGYDFLIQLAGIRPEGLIFDNLTFTESTTIERRRPVTTYTLRISGDTKDLTTLDNFKAALNSMPVIEKSGGTVDETIFQRDERMGIFPYSIDVILQPTG